MQGVADNVAKKNANPPIEAPKRYSGQKKIAVRPDLNPRWKNRDRAAARSKFLSTGAAGVKYEEEVLSSVIRFTFIMRLTSNTINFTLNRRKSTKEPLRNDAIRWHAGARLVVVG